MGQMHHKHLSHLLSLLCGKIFFIENFELED